MVLVLDSLDEKPQVYNYCDENLIAKYSFLHYEFFLFEKKKFNDLKKNVDLFAKPNIVDIELFG